MPPTGPGHGECRCDRLAGPIRSSASISSLCSKRRVVGALMVTFEWSDWRNKCFWWIQSVYVQPAHRRQGIFTRYSSESAPWPRTVPTCAACDLYVEQHNHIAQATYKSLGMDETHYDMYEVMFTVRATTGESVKEYS